MQMGIFRYNPDFRKKRSKHCAVLFQKKPELQHNALFTPQKNLSSASLIAIRIPQIRKTTPNTLAFRLHKPMIEKRKEKRSHHQRDSK